MRFAEVIGRVSLSKRHPTLSGSSWKIAVPLDAQGLTGNPQGRGEPLVVFDEWGSGEGSLIAVSDGAEAAAPFDNQKPLDAYCAALLDRVELAEKPAG